MDADTIQGFDLSSMGLSLPDSADSALSSASTAIAAAQNVANQISGYTQPTSPVSGAQYLPASTAGGTWWSNASTTEQVMIVLAVVAIAMGAFHIHLLGK